MEELGPGFRRAFVALQQGNSQEAARMLLRAADEEGDIAVIPYARGLLAWQRGDLPKAEAEFARSQILDPDFGPAVRKRAMVLREMGRPLDAVEVLAPRMESHPADREALIMSAAALTEAGQADRAIELFGPYAVQEHKKNPQVAVLWGRMQEGAGRKDEALGAYKAAAALQPGNPEVLEILGMYQLKYGGRELEGAVLSFKACFKAAPEKGWIYLLRICEAYALGGYHAEANAMLEEARAVLPDDPQARAVWEHFASSLKTVK